MEDYQTTKEDWERIKVIMSKHSRIDGYVDIITLKNEKKKLEFFDSDPKINNSSGMYVTTFSIDDIIKSYE